jgi:D-3-phosphoglycerate dehydrogenase / 2-oxoglutarate reductase
LKKNSESKTAMKLKVLANDGIDEAGKTLLERAGIEVHTQKVKQEDLIDAINKEGYAGLTVRSATQVRKVLIDACPGLKVIARGGVGMDNIDVVYAEEKGIKVINTPAASSNSVAELVLAHIITMFRFMKEAAISMPSTGSTEFNALKKKFSSGLELRGKSLGIIGFGRIGQSLGRIGLGCGMKVIASDPYISEAEIEVDVYQKSPIKVKINTIPMDELLETSDIISVHVPGGKLIGEAEIKKMKKGVFLVNASRGGVIDEAALLKGLENGTVAMAGLDVFENEPTPNPALLSHPRIIATPHIGASTAEAQERIGIELAEKIIAVLKRD